MKEKPTAIPNASKYISLRELCSILSISVATGKNWIKLGKLIPECTVGHTPFFTNEYVSRLRSELQSGENEALKSRRNKKYVSGNSLYHFYTTKNCRNLDAIQNLLESATKESLDFSPEIIQYLVADCALHLFSQKMKLPHTGEKPLLSCYLSGNLQLGEYGILVDALVPDKQAAMDFCKAHPLLFGFDYSYTPSEDFLGLLYLSCKNIGNRKATGSYYTPTEIVKRLISKLELSSDDKILDPCCGTGNFLLQLPDTVPFERIYGNDIDPISVKITRINMSLKYGQVPVDTIFSHITEQNFLTEYAENHFQHIIGNPPWGYDFTEDEKSELRALFQSASGKNIESYDVFIERSLNHLASGGYLSFVLPEALLNVKSHARIRRIILDETSVKYMEFLGNVFDGVQCPCMIFQIQHTSTLLSTVGLKIKTLDNKEIHILTEREISNEHFNFLVTDEEYHILEKIKNTKSAVFLKDNADFALGIVTGNNKKYITSTKNDMNEIILKGSDICKYHIKPSESFIVFNPERFQQTAPIELYRAPEKLLYRFISSQLVFAYDDKQALSLNSCNIVIPKIDNLQMKYILAILNSRVAQFLYKMNFNSVKVLRSHIESIPIPVVDETMQNTVIQIADRLISGLELGEAQDAYEQLDQIIFRLYFLTPPEQKIVKNAVDGENMFLT